MRELSHPCPGDAVSAIPPTNNGHAAIGDTTDEPMPLDLGSLVSLSINICEPLPALVASADERTFVLQTAPPGAGGSVTAP